MSSMDDDCEGFAHAEDVGSVGDCGGGDCRADELFGCYTVLAPGVQIVLEGRPVSAPAAD
jgi:hypothetical protein